VAELDGLAPLLAEVDAEVDTEVDALVVLWPMQQQQQLSV
jgi:hypothetical protein